jgi:hypothetical protein
MKKKLGIAIFVTLVPQQVLAAVKLNAIQELTPSRMT